jgi:hypothetical protein
VKEGEGRKAKGNRAKTQPRQRESAMPKLVLPRKIRKRDGSIVPFEK